MSELHATVGDVTTTSTLLRIVLSNGAQRVACNADHATRVLFLAKADDPAARLVSGPTHPQADVCSCCAWCGLLTHRVARCPLHDSCPPWDPMMTDHAGYAVSELLALSRLSVLPPRAWAYLDEKATDLAVADKLTGPALATVVWGVRCDWLR